MKEGWEYKTLGECCDIYNGNSINSDYKMKNFSGRKEGYPFIATKDVSFDGTINYENGIKIPFGTNYKIAFPDSVFICAEGGSAGRKIALVNKKVCFGNKLFCIAPLDNEEFIGKYIYYYMNSALFQNQFKSLLTGLIGGVSAKKFRDILLIKIPLDEQRRIVSYLDSSFKLIDEIKNKALKSLTEAKALFQSALAEAMEPKEGWEEKTLKDIGLTQTGTTPSKSNKAYYGNYIPFIRPSEINIDGLGTIEYNSEIMLSQKGIEAGRKFTKKSILMVCIGATIGKVGYSEKDISCNQQINVLSPYNGYNYKYLYYAMSSSVFQKKVIMEGTSAQATLPIINKGKWEKLLLYIPPLSTQKQIVSHLDKLSSKVRDIEEKYQKMVEECDALKQAMLRDVFE